MQRLRRLSSIALLATAAVLGAGTLTGCRSDPAVAAYVGDKLVTQSSVDDLERELADSLDKVSEGTSKRFDRAALRRLILSSMVIEEIGGKIAKDRRVAVPKADPGDAAGLFGVSADSPLAPAITNTRFAQSITTAMALIGAIAGGVEPLAPTEKDQRELYRTLVIGNGSQLPAFEEVRSLFGAQTVGRELRVRELFSDRIADSRVSVNPRYAPLEFQIPLSFGGAYGYVTMSISER